MPKTQAKHTSTLHSPLTIVGLSTIFNIMTVHSFYVFDRKGKTLFTKRYVPSSSNDDEEQLAEQRKLIFGMLFSLRELSSSLSPANNGDVFVVKTGASSLYNYETVSGLRFAMYTTLSTTSTSESNNATTTGPAEKVTTTTTEIRKALQHVYEHIWVTFVVRSPLYKPLQPNVASTNFEASLDNFLKGMSWFK